MRRVAEALGISRSQLHERLRSGLKERGRYLKADDAQLLEPLRRLVDERPTYGYRRIGALLNRERQQAGLPRLNHKRLYRVMAQNGLLLQRYTGAPPGRVHDGKIITIRPNLRWTSDGFEIACWNGEMIRDLMLEATEKRFGTAHTPQPIQWLSDNGSAYRANDTIDFAVGLGLAPCFTPVRSPQSNGMAEAFVKTFKRDYVYVHDRPDAQTVLAQLPRWFEDYNEVHPHKALQLKSPREFIRSLQQPAACPVG